MNLRSLSVPDVTDAEPDRRFVPPRNKLQFQLVKIFEAVLGVQPVGIKDNFFELGGQDLLIPRLHSQIQKVFCKAPPPAMLSRAPTVEQLAEILGGDVRSAQWSCLMPVQPRGTNPPFFCAHGYAGYAHLAKYLGLHQPFYGLIQGLDGKRVFTRVEEIAAAYLKELHLVQPKGPYFLGGHSFGGLVAFEMAQQLQRRGQKIALLAMIDTENLSRRVRSVGDRQRQGKSAIRWASICPKVAGHLRSLRALSAKEKTWYVASRLQGRLNQIRRLAKHAECEGYLRLGYSLPPELRTFYINKVLFGSVYQKAAQQYEPAIYEGDVVFFRSEKSTDSPESSWGSSVAGELKVYNIPGSHLSMLEKPNVQVITRYLREHLAQAPANRAPVEQL